MRQQLSRAAAIVTLFNWVLCWGAGQAQPNLRDAVHHLIAVNPAGGGPEIEFYDDFAEVNCRRLFKLAVVFIVGN